MNIELIITVVAIIFIIVALILLYKYKKEYLKVVAYYAVVQAEELYSNGHGKEKLGIIINKIKSLGEKLYPSTFEYGVDWGWDYPHIQIKSGKEIK